MNCESSTDIYIYYHIYNRSWKPAIKHRDLILALCDDLQVWDGGGCGRFKREGIYIYITVSLYCTAEMIQHCNYPSIKKKDKTNFF